MSEKEKSTHTMPGSKQERDNQADDGVVNDSFGTIDTADTTGTGEEDARCEKREESVSRNRPHHENSLHRP